MHEVFILSWVKNSGIRCWNTFLESLDSETQPAEKHCVPWLVQGKSTVQSDPEELKLFSSRERNGPVTVLLGVVTDLKETVQGCKGVNQTREACVACDMSWERGRWSTRAEDSAANMGLCLRYVDLTPVCVPSGR